jgi:hypothetical protein
VGGIRPAAGAVAEVIRSVELIVQPPTRTMLSVAANRLTRRVPVHTGMNDVAVKARRGLDVVDEVIGDREA